MEMMVRELVDTRYVVLGWWYSVGMGSCRGSGFFI